MHQYNKWLHFPTTYRRATVKDILQWIERGESGVVVGGSGTGKSNIAGYVATRTDIHEQILANGSHSYLFFLLDLNTPIGFSSLNLYLGMLNKLKPFVKESLDLQATISDAFGVQDSRYTTFMLYQALEDAHNTIIHQHGRHVIWVLDRFDSAISKLDAEALNSLRSLRDQFKDQISYVAFTRRPLAELRASTDFDEFHELMIMHTSWVGSMELADGQWVANQVKERYQVNFTKDEIHTIYALCGGWPAFLKLSYTALAEGTITVEKDEEICDQLLAIPAIYSNCKELWESHTKVEQDVLLSIAQWEVDANNTEPMIDEEICNELEQYYLVRHRDDNKWCLVAPLFAAFVRRQSIDTIRGVRIVNGIVYRNGQTLPKGKTLAPLEYQLLACFLGEAGYVEGSSRVFNHDELINAVWPDQYRTEIDLTNLVRNLRRKINRNGHDYIGNLRGRGYQFVQLV